MIIFIFLILFFLSDRSATWGIMKFSICSRILMILTSWNLLIWKFLNFTCEEIWSGYLSLMFVFYSSK